MSKTIFDLTEKQRAKKAALTPKEQAAVDAFIAAAKALPPSICCEIEEDWDGEGNLKVFKRITRGSCQQVAKLKKASLHF